MLTLFYEYCRLLFVADKKHSPLAQSVEQRTVNPPVASSNLAGGANLGEYPRFLFLSFNNIFIRFLHYIFYFL